MFTTSRFAKVATLAAAISFYARHPEHRAGIGTDDGYRRLRRALADGPQ